jgi:signal transduction histidine kinase
MVHSAAEGYATGEESRSNVSHSQLTTALIALGVGLACFAITELLHFLLVPDIGRQKERWLAEAMAALVVSLLTAKLIAVMRRQHEATLARLQVISEINHHIRNALMAIVASADRTNDEQYLHTVSECVERIDWALREILPREQPLPEEARSRLMFHGPSRSSVRSTRK